MRYCLEGIKVLEYCDTVAASYMARLLADWGAEVIKIERPSGDALRARPPFFGDLPHPERSCLFFYLNIGKLGVTLDLATATGREILAKLVRAADVVVVDQAPEAARRFGLDYPALSGISPRIVAVSLTPYGSEGPHSARIAYPLTSYQAGGDGYLLQCGTNMLHRPPVKAGGLAGEYEAAQYAAVAAVAACFFQRKTGLGQHVDVSQQEALMALNRDFVGMFAETGISESRASHGYPYCGTFPCKDGYVMVQALHDHLWQRLVEFMGNPSWALDERFRTGKARAEHGAEINERLRTWIKSHTVNELAAGQQFGIPIAAYATVADVAKSEQLSSRGFFVEIEHPIVGKVICPFMPYVTSDARPRAIAPPPLLGQHNLDILAGRLGYSRQHLTQMRSAGII